MDSKGHFKPIFDPGPSLANGWSNIEIRSGNMTFPHYCSDPVFPAKRYRTWDPTAPLGLSEGYFNDSMYASVISCQEGVEICNLHTNKCWNPKLGWKDPANRLQNLENLKYMKLNERELAFILLETALGDSSIEWSASLEAVSHCNFFDCTDLPHDQWILEVRRWFEASLAKIQFNVLDIARGTGNQGEDYKDIDPMYRGICGIVKFKSNGWRNVNFWGLFSLPGLVCGIFVASLRTEVDGDLWLTMGMKKVLASFETAVRLAILATAAIFSSFKLR